MKPGGVGRGRGHDGGVLERAGLLEGATHGGDGRALLADRDVDAAHLLVRVAGLPVGLLVDDRVDGDRGLAGRAVTDDQLALAAADGRQGVDRLDAGREGLVHRLAHHDAGSLELQRATALERGDLAEAVDRGAERVDHAAEVAVADGDREDLARATHDLALLDLVEVTQDHDADLAGVEVQRDAERAVLELEQLVGHDRGQAADAGDAVRGLGDGADLFLAGRLGLVVRHEALKSVADLVRTDGQLRHFISPVLWVCSKSSWMSVTGQPASLRPASSRRVETVPSMTSSPISTRMPPMTSGSTMTLRCTSRP